MVLEMANMADLVRIVVRPVLRRPPFWERHWSPEWGAFYYWNSRNGESRWIAPVQLVDVLIVQRLCPICLVWH